MTRPIIIIIFLLKVSSTDSWATDCRDSIPATPFARLQREFASPGKDYGSAPLWIWNTKVTNGQIDSMLQDYKDNGFGGAFVHPRAGLITAYLSDEWFALWKHAMEKARQLGLNLWIYDENSYPSGFGGGHVPATMPSSYNQGEMLEMHKADRFPADASSYFIFLKDYGERILPVRDTAAEKGLPGVYYVFSKRNYSRSPWYGGFSYVDLMAKGVTEQFLKTTMTGYEKVAGSEFGKTVKGIFSDEPNIEVQFPHCIRWTPDLFDAFYSRWGYRLEERLPSLLEEIGDWKKCRHDYYSVLSKLFIEGWSKPYSAYTAAHHLEWTGHYWEHEWPDPNHVPDNMAMYAWPQRPGIDMLFNQFTENDVNAQFGNIRSVKELASVANQLGKQRTLCETYGGSGYELRFIDMKRLGDWEFALGINTLDQHLSYMSMVGARKYDWPQTFGYQEPWWPYYGMLNRYFARLSWALTRGGQQNKILILEPTTTMWMYAAHGAENKNMMELAGRFQSFITKLEKSQVEYDLGCEEIIRDHGRVAGRKFVIGNRAYDLVIIPPGMENIETSTLALLQRYRHAGGSLLTFEKLQRLDGAPHEVQWNVGSRPEPPVLTDLTPTRIDTLAGLGGLRISIDPGSKGDLYHHRRMLPQGQFLFLSNADTNSVAGGTFSLPGEQILEMDLFSGQIKALGDYATNGRISSRFVLPPGGSALYFISTKIVERPAAKKRAPVNTTIDLIRGGPITVHRPAFNTLPIEFCDLRIGDTMLTDKHVYDAADTVFKHYGFSDGDPWNTSVQFMDRTVRRDTFSANTGFEAIYHFTIGPGVDVSQCRAVVEQPSLWQVSVNGHPVSPVPGQWWLDKGFAVYEIGVALRAGENTLSIRAHRMSIYAEIEPVYILGDFGLASAEKGWQIVAPATLRTGSWKEQGLPAYGGGIQYTRDFDLEKTKNTAYHLWLHHWLGTVAIVKVNDSLAGTIMAEPNTLDITRYLRNGKNQVDVEVIGSLKNVLGPHFRSPKPGLVSPWHFRYVKANPPGDRYDVLDYGLMDDFDIRTDRPLGARLHHTNY
ncbi:MAG: glycosyl hydrolase [Bacteroidota bacterium]|nr:glycosyl hydrolase [Bacteroidota bacterium]